MKPEGTRGTFPKGSSTGAGGGGGVGRGWGGGRGWGRGGGGGGIHLFYRGGFFEEAQ